MYGSTLLGLQEVVRVVILALGSSKNRVLGVICLFMIVMQ